MSRIAVIGANGQVASEICLLMRDYPSMELVPIARNRTGSAFLRHQGIRCRHGQVTNPAEAPQLLGDCDVVLNFALPLGMPRYTRGTNRLLIENSMRYSAPGAIFIYFSTQSVYRSFRPLGAPPLLSAYGKEKRRTERLVKRSASRYARKVFILRLGHVCGEFQDMTWAVRELIKAGPVPVPDKGEAPSSVVHTVTIVDAIRRIISDTEKPGTYDLVNVPQWTWSKVLKQEADAIGRPLTLVEGGHGRSRIRGRIPLNRLAEAVKATASTPAGREIGLRLLTRLPAFINDRAQAEYFRRRAITEAAPKNSSTPEEPFASFTFGPGGRDFLRSLSPTEGLLAERTMDLSKRNDSAAFAPDLPPAMARL